MPAKLGQTIHAVSAYKCHSPLPPLFQRREPGRRSAAVWGVFDAFWGTPTQLIYRGQVKMFNNQRLKDVCMDLAHHAQYRAQLGFDFSEFLMGVGGRDDAGSGVEFGEVAVQGGAA